MKKILYIILIALLSLLTMFFISFMIYVAKHGLKFNEHLDRSTAIVVKEETFDIKNIKNVKLTAVAGDVEVVLTDDVKLTVTQYANKEVEGEDKFVSKQTTDTVEISEKNKRCFGFCISIPKLYVISIPKTYVENLNLHTISGDIVLIENMKLNELTTGTTSGDVKLYNLETNNIKLNSVSGDIKVDDIKSTNIKVSTTSGDINLGKIISNVSSSSVSGSISITSLEGETNISTTSGDIEVGDLYITNDSKISSVSGEIELMVNQNSNVKIEASTTSGDKNINDSKINDGKYKLKLSTVSGDIEA